MKKGWKRKEKEFCHQFSTYILQACNRLRTVRKETRVWERKMKKWNCKPIFLSVIVILINFHRIWLMSVIFAWKQNYINLVLQFFGTFMHRASLVPIEDIVFVNSLVHVKKVVNFWEKHRTRIFLFEVLQK